MLQLITLAYLASSCIEPAKNLIHRKTQSSEALIPWKETLHAQLILFLKSIKLAMQIIQGVFHYTWWTPVHYFVCLFRVGNPKPIFMIQYLLKMKWLLTYV